MSNTAEDPLARQSSAMREFSEAAADILRPENFGALTLPELVKAERLASEAVGYLAHLSHLFRISREVTA